MAINLFSVFTATIISFILGFLWYGPLFGKKWMGLMGFTMKSMKSMKIKPSTAMALGFLSTLLMVYILAMFIDITNSTTISSSILIGFWVWLGFIATTTLGTILWEGKSLNLYLLNNAYNLINILLISIIIVVWP